MVERLYLSIYLSVCLSIYLSSTYLPTYLFFTPTSLFLQLHQSIHLSLAEKCPITLSDGSISLSE